MSVFYRNEMHLNVKCVHNKNNIVFMKYRDKK